MPKHLYNKSLLKIILVLSPILGVGQTKQYSEAFKSSNLNCTLNFNYFLSGDGDTIKNGEYLLTGSTFDFSQETKIKQVELRGFYQNNLANGKWLYSSKSGKQTGNPKISDYRVIYPLEGEEELISGNIENGEANEGWMYLHHKISIGKSVDTNVFVLSSFKNGIPIGAFTYNSPDVMVGGQLDRNGLLDGIWTTQFKEKTAFKGLKKIQTFEEGILKSYVFEYKGERIELNLDLLQPTNDFINFDTIGFKNNIFTLLANTSNLIQKRSANFPLSNEDIHALIKSRENQSESFFNKFDAFGNVDSIEIKILSNPIEQPRFKLQKFNLSEKEKELIATSGELQLKIEESLNMLLKDPQIDIYKLSFEEVAFYEAVLQIYDLNYDKLKTIIKDFQTPWIEYVNRPLFLASSLPDLNYPKEIKYDFKDTSRFKTYSFVKAPSKDLDLAKFVDFLKAFKDDIEHIDKKLAPILEKFKKEEKLAQQEKALTQKRDSIKLLFIDVIDSATYNEFHERFKTAIWRFTQKSFQQYAQSSFEDKGLQVGLLINCYEQLILSYSSFELLKRKTTKLEEVYTRTLWNPYTLTYMDEIVKERVYDAYKDAILPYLLQKFEDELACGKIEANLSHFSQLYNKMIQLRDEDTKEIEKALRRFPSLQNKIALLSLDFEKGNKNHELKNED